MSQKNSFIYRRMILNQHLKFRIEQALAQIMLAIFTVSHNIDQISTIFVLDTKWKMTTQKGIDASILVDVSRYYH